VEGMERREGERGRRRGRKDEGRKGTKEERQAGQVRGLHAKFHVNMFTVSASGGQKPQFWTNLEFWGL